jgi:hypothetical protein
MRAGPAERHIRPQIRDLQVENIAKLAHLAREIPDVITLWYGEGDLETPEFIRTAAKAALDRGETFYVPDMRGWPPLTAALAKYQTRLHGREIGLDRSTVTPGGMQALYLAVELVAEMGTNVVYLEPQWPNIRSAVHVVGAEPRAVALCEEAGTWRLDLEGGPGVGPPWGSELAARKPKLHHPERAAGKMVRQIRGGQSYLIAAKFHRRVDLNMAQFSKSKELCGA